MLRRAVIQNLKNIPALGGRVYQAFLAPANVDKPYATVKLATQIGSANISFAGTQPVEVYLYADQDSFINLDVIEKEVIEVLAGEIRDTTTGNYFELAWAPGTSDFVDPEKKLIGRRVIFNTALLMTKE